MKLLITLLLAILMMKSIYAQNYYCDCNGLELTDPNSGRKIGQCLTTLNGRRWCYVNENSGCYDSRQSSRFRGLSYSFDACQGGAIYEEPPAYKK